MAALTIVALGGLVSIELLIVFALLQGMLNAAAVPAHFAMMPKLVERQDISAIMALQSSCAQSARFFGPAIAGGCLVTLGAGTTGTFTGLPLPVSVAAVVSLGFWL